MCCGSGTILAEISKATKARFGFSTIDKLEDVATGFDIDPLAISLAKATWVVSLSVEIKAAMKPIVIPVFHADSLFAVGNAAPSRCLGIRHRIVMSDVERLIDDALDQRPREVVPAQSDQRPADIRRESDGRAIKSVAVLRVTRGGPGDGPAAGRKCGSERHAFDRIGKFGIGPGPPALKPRPRLAEPAGIAIGLVDFHRADLGPGLVPDSAAAPLRHSLRVLKLRVGGVSITSATR